MSAAPATRRHRLAVANRVAAAAGGGYAVAAMVAIAGAFALPMPRADAVVTAMLIAILALPVTAMACVWARSGARAWGGVAIACAALGLLAAAYGWRP